jgi:uncharacterized protein (UPF0212 family)
MVTKSVKKLTKSEIDILDKASNDFLDIGHTMFACPRCGNSFDFSQKNTSFQIRCKTNDCIRMTSRGI